MRNIFAALVVASALLVPTAAQAATSSETHVGGASASQTSQRTLKSALRKDVTRALRGVAKLDLATVASKGFTLNRIRALAAGRVSFSATARSTSRQLVTVTKGSRAFGKRGKKNVRVKLTRAGKQLLATANRVTLRVKATFKPRRGRRVTAVFRVTLTRSPGSTIGPEGGTRPPAVPVAPIPAGSTPLFSQNFERRGPWGGLSEQCAGSIDWGNENGDGYARLVLPADAAPLPFDATKQIERCELSHGGYETARPPGEYWYHAKIRLGEGFPHEANTLNWTTVQQWQEDRPAPGVDTRRVDGAMFVNSNAGPPPGRMYVEGEFLPLSQSNVFDTHAWHDFVVHGVWTDQPNGYIEWSIDGVPAGRTDGVTSETGRHFWKGGITRAGNINALQRADLSEITVYRK